MSKRKANEALNITDIEVKDVDDEESSEESSSEEEIAGEINVEATEFIEDQENIVTDDLEYIAKFAEIPVYVSDLTSPPEIVSNLKMEDSDNTDDDEEGDAMEQNKSEESSSDSESDDESEIEEIIQSKKKGMKSFLTEEEEDAFADEPPRTKHELVNDEDLVDSSDLNRTETTPQVPEFPQRIENIQLLSKVGYVLSSIPSEKTIVIQAYPTITPLNESSIICNEYGVVLGKITEVFGPVSTPFYIVRIRSTPSSNTSANTQKTSSKPRTNQTTEPMDEVETSVKLPTEEESKDVTEPPGVVEEVVAEEAPPQQVATVWDVFPSSTIVYTAPSYASYITPNLLSSMKAKGSDASNAFDEEPPEDEIEYSDDEQEMMAKRMKKKSTQQQRQQNNLNASVTPSSTSTTSKNNQAAKNIRQNLQNNQHHQHHQQSHQPRGQGRNQQPNPYHYYNPNTIMQQHNTQQQYYPPYAPPQQPLPPQPMQAMSFPHNPAYPSFSTNNIGQAMLHHPSQTHSFPQPTNNASIYSSLQYPLPSTGLSSQFLPSSSNSPPLPPSAPPASITYTLVYSPELGSYQYLPSNIQANPLPQQHSQPMQSVIKPPEPYKPPAPTAAATISQLPQYQHQSIHYQQPSEKK